MAPAPTARRLKAHRSGCLLAGALSGVEAFLHGLGGFELEHLPGGDLDGLTGLRIATLAGTPLDHLELAKAVDRDLLAPVGSLGHLLEDAVNQVSRVGPR